MWGRHFAKQREVVIQMWLILCRSSLDCHTLFSLVNRNWGKTYFSIKTCDVCFFSNFDMCLFNGVLLFNPLLRELLIHSVCVLCKCMFSSCSTQFLRCSLLLIPRYCYATMLMFTICHLLLHLFASWKTSCLFSCLYA